MSRECSRMQITRVHVRRVTCEFRHKYADLYSFRKKVPPTRATRLRVAIICRNQMQMRTRRIRGATTHYRRACNNGNPVKVAQEL